MELKTFISQALQDIMGAVDDAQKNIAYGGIVPNRDANGGETEIEFEVTVKPGEEEGEEGKLSVVAVTMGGAGRPPGAPGGGPPMPPHAGKLRFKVPVKLPEERWYHIFYRLMNEARLCLPSRKKNPQQQLQDVGKEKEEQHAEEEKGR